MKTAIFILSFIATSLSFQGIMPKIEKIYDRYEKDYPDCVIVWKIVPYKEFPFWCTDRVRENDKGKILNYKKITLNDSIEITGLIRPNKEIRVTVLSYIQREKIKSKVYRMFFLKKNSKGVWYHARKPLKMPLKMLPDGSWSCQQ